MSSRGFVLGFVIVTAIALASTRASAHGDGPNVARAAVQPFDGALVSSGYVVASDLAQTPRRPGRTPEGEGVVGPHTAGVALVGEFHAASPDDGPRSVRVAALGVDLGNGFALLVGGFVRRSRPMIGAESESVTLGVLQYHRAFLIEREGHIELLVDASVSVSALQRARAEEAFLREVDGELRFCSSQSDAGVSVGVRIARSLSVRVAYETQDDPFHFGEGYGCLGDGPIWFHSQTFSGILRAHVAGRARIGVQVVHRRAGLGWDVPGGQRTRGTAVAEGTTVMATLEMYL